jgi:hypothetical protein
MGKYLILIALALTLTACPATEKYRAEQQAAIAQQEAARADQLAQQARMVEAEQQSAQMKTLADAAKPTYWPMIAIVAIGAVVMLTFMRWHMVTVSHVAAGQPVRELRMLPGEVSFGQMRIMARRQGYELDVQQGSYFLVDGDGKRQKIKALIGEDA